MAIIKKKIHAIIKTYNCHFFCFLYLTSYCFIIKRDGNNNRKGKLNEQKTFNCGADFRIMAKFNINTIFRFVYNINNLAKNICFLLFFTDVANARLHIFT